MRENITDKIYNMTDIDSIKQGIQSDRIIVYQFGNKFVIFVNDMSNRSQLKFIENEFRRKGFGKGKIFTA